jgi:surface protein
MLVLLYDTTLGSDTTKTIFLPLGASGDVDVEIDWGDDNQEKVTQNGPITHTYATDGEYLVSIRGTLEEFGKYLDPTVPDDVTAAGSVEHLKKVINFGSLGTQNWSWAFHKAKNLEEVQKVGPSTATNMQGMFQDCSKFNDDLSGWSVSTVTNFAQMFAGCSVFNQDISGWQTSGATDLTEMFKDAFKFEQNLSSWPINAGVTPSTCPRFGLDSGLNCSSLPTDLPDECTAEVCAMLLEVTITNITQKSGLAFDGTHFNLVIDWGDGTATQTLANGDGNDGYREHYYSATGTYIIKITGAAEVFGIHGDFITYQQLSRLTSVISFGQLGLKDMTFGFGYTPVVSVPKILPSSITNIARLFEGCRSFNSENVVTWDTSKITTMDGLFEGAWAFNQDIGGWDVSSVTSMDRVFHSALAFDRDLSAWDVSKVTTFAEVFYNTHAFNNGGKPLTWDVSSAENMSGMFQQTRVFNAPINSWDVSQVTVFTSMFSDSRAFNQPLDQWRPSSATTFSQMFQNGKFHYLVCGFLVNSYQL